MIEGGQEIAISVTQDHDASKLIVDVSYKETKWLRAASAYLNGLFSKSTNDGQSITGLWKWPRVPALALGVLVLLLTVAVVVRLMQNRNAGTSPPETATINRQDDKPVEPTAPKTKNGEEHSSGVNAPSSSTPTGSAEQRAAQSNEKVTSRATETAKAIRAE